MSAPSVLHSSGNDEVLPEKSRKQLDEEFRIWTSRRKFEKILSYCNRNRFWIILGIVGFIAAVTYLHGAYCDHVIETIKHR